MSSQKDYFEQYEDSEEYYTEETLYIDKRDIVIAVVLFCLIFISIVAIFVTASFGLGTASVIAGTITGVLSLLSFVLIILAVFKYKDELKKLIDNRPDILIIDGDLDRDDN